jgi:hypothetical protein
MDASVSVRAADTAEMDDKRKTVMLVEPPIDGSQWGAKRGLDPRRSRFSEVLGPTPGETATILAGDLGGNSRTRDSDTW